MSFINPVWFKADLPQITVMRFIAETPPEYYLMGSTGGSVFYVVTLTDDVIEYLANEFQVRDLVITSPAEVKNVLRSCCKKWCNSELLDL